MKKAILLFAVLFSFSAFSQIKVLKNVDLVEVGRENSVGLYKKSNRYTFSYIDTNTANLNTVRSFSFNDINKDLEQLYKMISSGLVDVPVGDVTLELPNDIINLHFARNYGQPTVQFVQMINKNKNAVGKSQFLNRKQIDKIFGKYKPGTSYAETEKPATDDNADNSNTSKKKTSKRRR